jgi:hypothetical protein
MLHSVGRDVTERMRAEQALRTLGAVFDATTDYVVQLDPKGRLTYMNPAARGRTGVALDASIDHLTLADFNPPQTLRKMASEIRACARSAGVWVGESVVWDAERREFPVSHIVICHRDKQGKVEYFSAAFFLRNPLAGGLRPDQLSIARERFVGEAMQDVVVIDNHSMEPVSFELKLEFAADARYTSLQYYYVTPQDTANRYLLTQPGYTLANARVTYTTANEKVSASFFVNNLLDTTYRNHALPAAAPGTTGDVVQYGDPRTIGGSLIYRF